ncbi:MAG: hypothetical protein M3347_04550, partial [Armatimonadota bacterium]|nr:hypothetical protein [Armatimonadota bacterium]
MLTSNRTTPLDRLGRLAQGQARAVKKPLNPMDRVLEPAKRRPVHQGSFVERVVRPTVDRLTDQSSLLMKNVKIDEIRYRLLRAGFPMGLGAKEFHLLRVAAAMALAVLFLAWVPILEGIFGVSLPIYLWWMPMLFGSLYGWKAPDIWLNMTIKRRQSEIVLALPDMM